MKMKFLGLFFVAAAVTLSGCRGLDFADGALRFDGGGFAVLTESQTLNPSGIAPLTAELAVATNVPTRVAVTVDGKNSDGDLHYDFADVATEHRIPILGLYADTVNTVRVTFYSRFGVELGEREYAITTEPLIDDMPDIRIDFADSGQMADGWTFVSYYGRSAARAASADSFPLQPFMFDANGDIRWYLNLHGHPIFGELNYGNGMERLANGNLYFGDKATNKIYEMDMLGRVLNEWAMPGYGFHHQVEEKPNGNFVVSVSKLDAGTVEDYMIEIDRQSGDIINVWDFNLSFEYGRRKPFENVGMLLDPPDVDWFHVNGLAYDRRRQDGVVVSARTQGLVKVTAGNEPLWIMAPHTEWGRAGNGADLNRFLLQPLDAAGEPITDEAVLEGESNHPDFEWPWYMHSPKIMPNGNILVFDNGNNRNFWGNVPGEGYSRAVEYAVDAEQMTVRQVWQYGKERGEETFSTVVSDIDYAPDLNRMFFSAGGVKNDAGIYGKIVELDYADKEVFFEATLTPPQAFGIMTFHRSERMPIYPAGTASAAPDGL